MLAGESDHALKEPVGPDIPLINGRLSPAQSSFTNVRCFGQQVFLIGLLAGRFVSRTMLVQGAVGAGGSLRLNANTLSVVIDTHKAFIPAGPYFLPQQPGGY
jgi:hypothetical protein